MLKCQQFISIINTIFESLTAEKNLIFQQFSIYEQLQVHAQLISQHFSIYEQLQVHA